MCEAHEKLIKPSFAPISEIKASLHIEGDNCQLVLCQEHYQELYRKFLGPSPCASCDIKPKKGTYFVRHSPNADLVNKILGTPNTEGTQPIIKADNKICSACYKSHLAIIKSHEQDNKLDDLIKLWENVLCTESSVLTKSVLETILHIANYFQRNRAELLPHVCRFFLKTYFGSDDIPESPEQILENKEGTIKFTSRWLLHQLNPNMCISEPSNVSDRL